MFTVTKQSTRTVNELLGKHTCSILPARRESDTFPGRRGRQEFFPGRTFLPDKNRGGEKRSPWSAAHGGRRNYNIPQEMQNDKSLICFCIFSTSSITVYAILCFQGGKCLQKNSCRWLLVKAQSDWREMPLRMQKATSCWYLFDFGQLLLQKCDANLPISNPRYLELSLD